MTKGIACPQCGEQHRLFVTDSRPHEIGIRRRRMCEACTHRFTSYEIAAEKFHEMSIPPDVKRAVRVIRAALDTIDAPAAPDLAADERPRIAAVA